ncbi:MAG TPA: hypothetical protein VFA71_08720 [Terriglobales bacterium]|nr:hypothetical protein [Terriglobales bacterium]
MAKAWIVNVIILVLASVVVNAQNSASQLSETQISTANSSDPHALSLAAQSVQALTGGVAVADVTLTGTATQTAGSWKSNWRGDIQGQGVCREPY